MKPECDRQKDGQNYDHKDRACIASRGKNANPVTSSIKSTKKNAKKLLHNSVQYQ